MRNLLNNIFDGMYLVIDSMIKDNNSIFSQRPLINEDFLGQFNNESDRELLNTTVTELKNKNQRKKEIILSGGRKITIVVD